VIKDHFHKTLTDLISLGESETLEFKTSFDNETVETLVAFANTRGGSVMVRVSNRGELLGIHFYSELLTRWINEIKNKTSPALIPDIHVFDLKEELKIVQIMISEFPIKPVSFKGRYYKRIQSANHLMSTDEVVNLHMKTFNSSWDYLIDPSHTLADISLEKVKLFIEKINQNRDTQVTDDPVSVCANLNF
jgi:ATP-dependent DNA helicase RecG